MVRRYKHFLIICVLILNTTALFQAQSQSGFISIDCGSSNVSSYTDKTTGITYNSDTNYTETGVNAEISAAFKLRTDEKQLWSVRSFPEGKRNCYTLEPLLGKSSRYLIRARFFYGNYDNKGLSPEFALYLGVDLWDIVLLDDPRRIITKEIVYVPLSDYIHVCLVNTGNGDPFVSVLELRPLSNEAYSSPIGKGLRLSDRYDIGSNSDKLMRYKDDIYDRLWRPLASNVWQPLNTSLNDSNSITKNIFGVPFDVMNTAYTRNTTTSFMGSILRELKSSSEYFIYMHFAELKKLKRNEAREFHIFFNETLQYGPISPPYLTDITIYTNSSVKPDIEGNIMIWINKTDNSTLPPLLNALEIYELKELPQLQTNQTDIEAVSDIKLAYGLKINTWQGDPCAPKDCLWDRLNCSYNGKDPHRITSLNLTSINLKGNITSLIAGLTMLEYLDLSNNSLEGTVPEFLANLQFLKFLNLKGNNLNGPLPSALLERSKNGLSLSVDANVDVSSSTDKTSASSTAFTIGKNTLYVSLAVTIGAWFLNLGF